MSGIGSPARRVDGPAKVTGQARFVGDLPFPDLLDGVFVGSPVPAGRIESLEVEDARRSPGVVAVWTRHEVPRIAPIEHWAAGQSRLPLQSDDVLHEGEPVALVLAESRMAARIAARLVRVRIEPTSARLDLEALEPEAVELPDWSPNTTSVGDLERGFREAEVRVEQTYRTADRHHAAIEPAVAVARWTGDDLEVWTSTQWVNGVRGVLAEALATPPERIRVRAPYVGGGFGAKGSTWPHEIYAALAARRLGRPVRIGLSRADGFTAHGYHPGTIQRIALGARRDGTLTAIRHASVAAGAMADDYVEHGSLGTRSMYACPNLATDDRVVRLNKPQPTFMRAPHEGPGMAALEMAMDELAQSLRLDPVELRLRNYAEADPTSGRPFSSKALRECYRLGAERFGWRQRTPEPGSMRQGGELVGWGMASALMSTFRFGSSARVTIRRDGTALVESATHDIGSGVPTMLAQVAADALGLEPARVEVAWGDTALPEAGGTFGSATTIGVGSAVRLAAQKLRKKLEELGGEPDLRPDEYGEVLALRRLEQVAEAATWAPAREEGAWAMNAYGAVFVEVRVNEAWPVPRVNRCLGVYSVGRIINPLGARSQAVGGLIWGLGQALLEDSGFDPVLGRFGKSFASYRVPVSADVPSVEALFVEEHDPHASLLGARGVGEIGTIGVGAAVANAVWHATGVRVRDLPIRVERLMAGAPS